MLAGGGNCLRNATHLKTWLMCLCGGPRKKNMRRRPLFVYACVCLFVCVRVYMCVCVCVREEEETNITRRRKKTILFLSEYL